MQCLHVANALSSATNHLSPTYDKLYKLQWMINEVCSRFQAMGSLNQQLTVDESMIIYKGIYYSVRQYMPRNLLDLASRFELLQMRFQNICRILKFIVESKEIPMMKLLFQIQKWITVWNLRMKMCVQEKEKDYMAKV
jgi:hypothetical protein